MDLDIIKRRLNKRIKQTFEEYQAQEGVQTRFADPVIEMISTVHPMFDTFFARGENDHPKNIWRPGYSVIVYYIPFAEKMDRYDPATGRTTPQWEKALEESRWLAMKVNATIQEVLTGVGRLYSRCSTMVDWDSKKHRYNWSNTVAGYLAGIGSFGPAGSFRSEYGFGGRIGAMMTDGVYVKKPEEIDGQKLEEEFEAIMSKCCYQGAEDVNCSEEMIAACPGGAISKDGIDRQKCQDFCAGLNPHDPCPDRCGCCFEFGK